MIRVRSQLKVDGRVVLVCGGRDFDEERFLFKQMDLLHSEDPIALLVHGSAKGADRLAEKWAKLAEIPYLGVPAEWEKLGRRGGMVRNRAMPQLAAIDLVVAFRGNVGTRGMLSVAEECGIPTLTPGWKP